LDLGRAALAQLLERGMVLAGHGARTPARQASYLDSLPPLRGAAASARPVLRRGRQLRLRGGVLAVAGGVAPAVVAQARQLRLQHLALQSPAEFLGVVGDLELGPRRASFQLP